MEFMKNAAELRVMLLRFALNEKNIPKRYRQYLANPLIDDAHSLVNNLVAANTIYPTSVREFEERRRYQTLAKANVHQIYQDLQLIIEVMGGSVEKYSTLSDMLDREAGLIENWRKSDGRLAKRILPDETAEEGSTQNSSRP